MTSVDHHVINGTVINGKYLLATAQWYITHSCNLTCTNCLSFNNFAISGHSKFSNNKLYAEEWNKLVYIADFTIIGGETFTVPHLDEWLTGLRNIFDYIQDFKLITNGTLFYKHKENIKKWIDLDVIIEVSLHNKSHIKYLLETLKDYKYEMVNITDIRVPQKYQTTYQKAVFIDNKLSFLINYALAHQKWGVQTIEDGKFKFYNSNSIAAHETCWQKDCHYFYEGYLYKCGTIVGAREFVKKYSVDKSVLELYNSYSPIGYNDQNLQEKLTAINYHTDQCALCPVDSVQEILQLTPKKVLPK